MEWNICCRQAEVQSTPEGLSHGGVVETPHHMILKACLPHVEVSILSYQPQLTVSQDSQAYKHIWV
jgi:hypothetical protein